MHSFLSQNLRLAWRAWHFSAQLHHLVDHYCGIAARSGVSGSRKETYNAAFSLVLCPCAMRAMEQGQPVDCKCDAATAGVALQDVSPFARQSWSSNPAFEGDEEQEDDSLMT